MLNQCLDQKYKDFLRETIRSSDFRNLPTDPNLILETDLDPFICILTFACPLPNASFPSTSVQTILGLGNHGGAEYNQML